MSYLQGWIKAEKSLLESVKRESELYKENKHLKEIIHQLQIELKNSVYTNTGNVQK